MFLLYLWNVFRILTGIALNLWNTFSGIDILMMLILPIHEHGIFFHLFVSSLISFFNVVSFSEYRFLSPRIGLFLSILFFLLLYQMGFFFSWFLFLIFHCWCTKMPLISEYWLCILLFCQIHLLGQVVFWWSLQGFLCILSWHLQIMTVCLPVWMPFLSFSCLIAVARTSSTMLNWSGGREHPCLVPNLSKKL